jgi:hypothetical protein
MWSVVKDRLPLRTSEATLAVSKHAVGTEFEAPESGSHPGPVRMPLKMLQELVKAAGGERPARA